MLATSMADGRDIYKASSVAEIRATLAELGQQEATVTARLDALLASQRDLSRQLTKLDLARAHLGSQVVHIRSISNGMLSSAASTAARISGAVNQLDREQAAVKSTLNVVDQVAELKACVLGVNGSMGAAQDWETAAEYLHRASQIPDHVIDGAFAQEIVPTAEVPDAPRVTLTQASDSLCGLFLREFDKAAAQGDGQRVTRFFKLFPLIAKSEQGLDAYGRYVCTGVATRARSNLSATNQRSAGLFYASALTKLFEQIALIVDGHSPLVERHYGQGSMAKVIERLQTEADTQGGIVLDAWADERSLARKINDVKSYAFSFLVQSFLPSQKSSAARSSSPASSRASEDETVNMKEIDALLSETAMMLSRWALYTRFVATKIHPGVEEHIAMPDLLVNSRLNKKIADALIEPFNTMSTFFFRRSVEKAFQMDESPFDLTLNPNKPLGSNPPFITSAVDDVMYIVNQVIQRTLATSQRSVVASVMPSVSRVLTGDFFGMIQRKMRDESYPKAAIQGALPPESIIISFLVLVNNLDVSTDYLRRIINTNLGKVDPNNQGQQHAAIPDLFPFAHDAVFVETALSNILTTFESKTSDLISEAIEVLLKQVMRPRLRPVFVETFRDVEYFLDVDTSETTEPDLQVPQRFERGWMQFTRPIKRILTERTYDALITSTLSYLARALEKRIWSYYGRVNERGAAKLERDISGIVNAAVKGGKYSLRDAFQRCTEMTLILNMEEDEWEEVRAQSVETQREAGLEWHLDASERARTRSIMTDSR
ncbi:COG4-domain-containing protein [Aureobasidium namibiae CBS 147.97]|uniref:Conserved oligomeric Golgi complex subunit 4 n=1 Tax=Aureobasidium namibiae CBS 147.97 TaxID=1043004 RepID=A0A074WNG7_9PEZI|nr:COG4-domain-containing protein [Aureobasidium namibiae CBS 147.97]KEQ74683.1 COG4-domain-containing protein [Aureobasidium namibiae CBS 147.97]